MAISGQQNINIGAENTQTGSDSLYTAFNKVQDNFTKLFGNSSNYNTFNAGAGIAAGNDSANGIVTVTNTGVTSLTAGTGIAISSQTGNIIISASGNGNVGVTSVDITSNTLTISGNTIVSSGIFTVDLPTLETTPTFAPGDYIAPSVTVDETGRITAIANTESIGTVTSVALQANGSGLSVTNSPITSNGVIYIENTGVTKLNQGRGILLSGSSGEISISTTTGGQGSVTEVEFFSNSLTITGSPVTTTGNVNIDLPNNISVSGNITANYLIGNGSQLTGITGSYSNTNVSAYLPTYTGNVTGNYFIGNGSTLTNITGSNVSGYVPNANVANSATTAGTVTTNAQPNITSVGTLSSLTSGTHTVSANANITMSGELSQISGVNLVSATYFTGTLTTAAQPNITSVGTLSSLTSGTHTVSANANIAMSGALSQISGVTLVSAVNSNVSGNLVIGNLGALLFNTYADSSKQVALQAPDNIASGTLLNWFLPNTQGNVGEFLTNTGNSTRELEWKTVATTAPLANNSTGQVGQIAYDSGYIYVCVATNSWKRAALATWP